MEDRGQQREARESRSQQRKTGVLGRSQLEQLAQAGALRNTEMKVLIGQDTLKLHVGRTVWITNPVDGQNHKKSVDIRSPIRIAPGGVATIITQEEVSVPLDMTGCIYPRGRLLPLGILSTAVHIDPGFQGNCRVIVFNLGNQVVDIPFGYEIARLQLAYLLEKLKTPYVGVNAELSHVNPRADDLVVPHPWESETQQEINAMRAQIKDLEIYVQQQRVRRRRWRVASLVGLSFLVIALLAAIAIAIGGAVAGSSVKDIAVQIVTGATVGIVAIVSSFASAHLRTRLRLWLNDATHEDKS